MTAIANDAHRVTSAVAEARASIGSVAEVPVWSMDAAETAAAITDLTRAQTQLAELKSRLLTHADRIDVAATTGAPSTANWYAVATQTTKQVSTGSSADYDAVSGHPDATLNY